METTFSDIIERMKTATNLKNSSQIAKALNITPQAITNYKKRDRVPTSLVLRIASSYNLSVDWILWGTGNMRRPEYQRQIFTDTVAAEAVLPYKCETDRSLSTLDTLSNLTPDELIYLGKLLKVLRSANEDESTTVKLILDSFVRAVTK